MQCTTPLQIVMPTTPFCRTPSPPSHRVLLEKMQMQKKPTQYTPIKFKDDFYCIPLGILEMVLQKRNLDSFREGPTVSYVGLGPQFGADSRYFDKATASLRKWLFFPVCIDHHWWMYAFKIPKRRLWILDIRFQGRIIEDIAKVSMPAYELTENGPTHFYPSIPKQHNGCRDMCVKCVKRLQGKNGLEDGKEACKSGRNTRN
ncbi:hypothetical protein AHAS_Ahas01G0125900 [Arachis hypogaea]